MNFYLNYLLFIFNYFFLGIGIIYTILKGYDFYILYQAKLSRAKIGQFCNDTMWVKSVKAKSFEWVVNMPQVQLSDSVHFILLEKISRKYTKKELQAWHKGGLIIGISQCIRKNHKDIESQLKIQSILRNLFSTQNKWKESCKYIDYAILAYSIMKLPCYDNTYFCAMNTIAEMILEHKGPDGTVVYRKEIGKYRLVDTIGMICPFLIRFGYLYDRHDLIELALTQIKKFILFGIDKATHIPAHAYHIDFEVPLGVYGWCRGIGWYAMGLIDSYEELLDNTKKSLLEENVILLAESLIKFQRSDGGWGCSVFIDNSVCDSSGTAMLLYFLKKAMLFNLINGEMYLGALRKGITKLKSVTRLDGCIDYSQGDTKDVGIYSNIFNQSPFTQGIVLALLSMYE